MSQVCCGAFPAGKTGLESIEVNQSQLSNDLYIAYRKLPIFNTAPYQS